MECTEMIRRICPRVFVERFISLNGWRQKAIFAPSREVAQAGSAPGLGPGGRRFESCLPDETDKPRAQARVFRLEARRACSKGRTNGKPQANGVSGGLDVSGHPPKDGRRQSCLPDETDKPRAQARVFRLEARRACSKGRTNGKPQANGVSGSLDVSGHPPKDGRRQSVSEMHCPDLAS